MTAALLGVDLVQAMERARVSFGEVSLSADSAQSPSSQIVCTGSMQIDGSSAQAVQDIVTLPHLRWSINFAAPTYDPQTAAFTIAIDPGSLLEGMLINGQPPQGGNAAAEDSAPAPAVNEAPQTGNGMSEAEAQDAMSEDAQKAALEAKAAERQAAAMGDYPEPPSRQPSDEDLYAPHSN